MGEVVQADLGLSGGDRAGGLIVGAQPADQSTLFFRRPLVIERDEAGEKLLFQRFGRGARTTCPCAEEITGGAVAGLQQFRVRVASQASDI